ncbi:MAG: hypothetical protein ACHQ0J_01265 [Candidatus Dormibacterales bacterium]
MAELFKVWLEAQLTPAGVNRATLARHRGTSVQAIYDLEGREDSRVKPATRAALLVAIEELAAERRVALEVVGHAVLERGLEILTEARAV